MPAYRLVFNTLALGLLVPPLALTFSLRGSPLWQWTGLWAWVSWGLSATAIFGFLWSLRSYDGLEFLGLRQWRARVHGWEDQERLHLSVLHRFVRHPWYFLGLVLVWTRDMDPALLTASLVVTLYLWLGSLLEERKLLIYHRDAYRYYRARVPGLIPLPWKRLSREEAARLERQAATEKTRRASTPRACSKG
jgi:protein-S-isoprenylcysteine O-methyltransferase Ste14